MPRMTKKTLLVTGAAGLIGSEVATFLAAEYEVVHGVDNNMRATFFGPQGDTVWRRQELAAKLPNYKHHEVDIRNRAEVLALIEACKPDVIVHAAAQPSHDLAAKIPFDDFDTNAVGTLNLLEATRRYCPQAVFVFMSTNKVYGDAPNRLALKELPTRWDYADAGRYDGIAEDFTIDQSKHSLFGASKAAADLMVQEYGRSFDMPTCCLRGGCLTGPAHSGVELHGFLSYLIKCNLERAPYTVFGYKAKQVRDNIHSLDVARFTEAFIAAPRVAAVYNIGGGMQNSISMLEAFEQVELISGVPMEWTYQDENRIGDHICYYSDLRRIRADYPDWDLTKDLQTTLEEIVSAWQRRLAAR